MEELENLYSSRFGESIPSNDLSKLGFDTTVSLLHAIPHVVRLKGGGSAGSKTLVLQHNLLERFEALLQSQDERPVYHLLSGFSGPLKNRKPTSKVENSHNNNNNNNNSNNNCFYSGNTNNSNVRSVQQTQPVSKTARGGRGGAMSRQSPSGSSHFSATMRFDVGGSPLEDENPRGRGASNRNSRQEPSNDNESSRKGGKGSAKTRSSSGWSQTGQLHPNQNERRHHTVVKSHFDIAPGMICR